MNEEIELPVYDLIRLESCAAAAGETIDEAVVRILTDEVEKGE